MANIAARALPFTNPIKCTPSAAQTSKHYTQQANSAHVFILSAGASPVPTF
jgi:hypothetical protein